MADDLKLAETSTLIMLLDAGKEVPRTYLTERGFKLEAPTRKRLEDLKLVDVRLVNRRVHLGLSDKGWARALQMITESTVPSRNGGPVIHLLVGVISRFLDRTGTPPAEFFASSDEPIAEKEPTTDSADADIKDLVRAAYGSLAANAGDQVSLARIRAALPSFPRSDVDEALVALSRESDVWIDPESDQKTLTDEERAAAVNIGNQDKHMITIVRR